PRLATWTAIPGGGFEPPLPGPKPGVLANYTTPDSKVSLGPHRQSFQPALRGQGWASLVGVVDHVALFCPGAAAADHVRGSLPGATARTRRRPSRSTIPKVSGQTVLIMAAGEGTRMRSSVPKMLHPVCGRPMIAWPA